MPIFPELKKEIEHQFDEAAEESVFVIDRWRNTEKNMRAHFQRIIFRAATEGVLFDQRIDYICCVFFVCKLQKMERLTRADQPQLLGSAKGVKRHACAKKDGTARSREGRSCELFSEYPARVASYLDEAIEPHRTGPLSPLDR